MTNKTVEQIQDNVTKTINNYNFYLHTILGTISISLGFDCLHKHWGYSAFAIFFIAITGIVLLNFSKLNETHKFLRGARFDPDHSEFINKTIKDLGSFSKKLPFLTGFGFLIFVFLKSLLSSFFTR